jgi:hypothetical protein
MKHNRFCIKQLFGVYPEGIKISSLWIFLLLLLFPPVTASGSEEDSFQSLSQDEGAIEIPGPPAGSISLAFSFAYSNATRYSSDFAFSVEDDLLQAGPSLQGYIRLYKSLGLNFFVPYWVKGTLGKVEQETNLPGMDDYELQHNHGMGDSMVGLSHMMILGHKTPLAIRLNARAIIPTGMSKYDPEYPGYLPLGNGFGGVSSSIKTELYLSNNFWVFGLYHQFDRFSRTFESLEEQTEMELNPGPIQQINAGIAFKVLKDLAIQLEFEKSSIGEIVQTGNILEPVLEDSFDVERLGVRFVDPRPGVSSGNIFLGNEKSGDQSTFFISISLPTGFRIFNISL